MAKTIHDRIGFILQLWICVVFQRNQQLNHHDKCKKKQTLNHFIVSVLTKEKFSIALFIYLCFVPYIYSRATEIFVSVIQISFLSRIQCHVFKHMFFNIKCDVDFIQKVKRRRNKIVNSIKIFIVWFTYFNAFTCTGTKKIQHDFCAVLFAFVLRVLLRDLLHNLLSIKNSPFWFVR